VVLQWCCGGVAVGLQCWCSVLRLKVWTSQRKKWKKAQEGKRECCVVAVLLQYCCSVVAVLLQCRCGVVAGKRGRKERGNVIGELFNGVCTFVAVVSQYRVSDVALCCIVLQCVACCSRIKFSNLQCSCSGGAVLPQWLCSGVAVCRSVLHVVGELDSRIWVAVCCGVLQRVAVCCMVLAN